MKTLQIELSAKVKIYPADLSPDLVNYLKKHLYVHNYQYFLREKMGKSTWKIPKGYSFLKEGKEHYTVPRGVLGTLIKYCQRQEIPYQLSDLRPNPPPVQYNSEINLYPYQNAALKKLIAKDFGILVSPPGTGKTLIALELIARRKLPALILVHRKQLLSQWIDRIQSFLKIPKSELGYFTGNKKKEGDTITLGMLQTLSKYPVNRKLQNSFGTVVIDECHHLPANTFRKAIIKFNSRYCLGLTATPTRKNKDEKLIYFFIGDIVDQIKNNDGEKQLEDNLKVCIKKTNIKIPFNWKIDDVNLINKILIYDTGRNMQIKEDVENQISQNKKILLLTERNEHVEILNYYLKPNHEVITISGQDSTSRRKEKIDLIKKNRFQVLISTGQFFGEGMDVPCLNCLFLVFPFSFEGKLIQYIGRIQRKSGAKMIFDYYDHHLDYYQILFSKRLQSYRKFIHQIEYI